MTPTQGTPAIGPRVQFIDVPFTEVYARLRENTSNSATR